MKLTELFRSIQHTFRSNRTRSLLTLLGIVIGSGSIVLLAGLLHGAEQALLAMNQGVNESDTLRIHRDEAPAHLMDRARQLNQYDGRALDESPHLVDVDVTVEARRETKAYLDGREKRVRLIGAEVGVEEMYRLELARGRFLDAYDLRDGRRVAVIGQEIYTELLGADPSFLGKQLRIDEESWTIVGILEHKPVSGHGTGTWMWNRRVIVPRSAFDATFSPSHDVHSLFLRARGRSATQRWMSVLGPMADAILLRRHGGVRTFKLEDRKGDQQEKLILSIIQILLLGTGLMSMFVGGINIMNIMLVTVTERTKEIGTRRALGATQGAILRQFVAEAAAVSFIGGVLGVIGGVGLSWLAVQGLAEAFGEWPFHVAGWSVALSLGLALVTGVLFGLFPAWRAARLPPVLALRME